MSIAVLELELNFKDMSDYTDYMETQFFGELASTTMDIDDMQRWINTYLHQRENYPSWITKDGKEIKVGDITDSHIENLLNFVPSDSTWHKMFEYEKKYRKLKDELIELKNKESYYREVANLVF